MSKLTNVRGRITYISSHAKQENLYAVYETTDRSYWTELARYNQQEFKKSNTPGKCIEARELIIALPESFQSLYDPNSLLQLFTNRFKEKYGVECVSALHHNKRKTNYHIHLIFSERELLPEPIEKIATRNMFYDEKGNHVRTKKEILDENGNIRKGCKIVKKGNVYERNLFTTKDTLFKQESFVDEAKHFYTDLINLLIKDDMEKLHVFDKNGLYLATKKIGKRNPKAEQIQSDNEIRMKWNHEVDRAIVSEVSEGEIRQIKKEYITDRIKTSMEVNGNRPELFGHIIGTAIAALALLISKVLNAARELKNKLFQEKQAEMYPIPPEVNPETISEVSNISDMPVSDIQKKPEAVTPVHETAKPQIPPKPSMPADAKAFPKLSRIYQELNQHNDIIFEAEKERNALEDQRDSLKGLAKLTKKGDLQARIDRKNEQIETLKKGLKGIVWRYGFQTVQDFYRSYHASASAYRDYQSKVKNWESTYGISESQKGETISQRMERYQKEKAEQTYTPNYQKKNRGAR
ncbi:MAG: MobA/MobL family protein [Oscillospiraceae bacterium]|nr:MobA/MobL family protein [Oscillospiraceae bacterium]